MLLCDPSGRPECIHMENWGWEGEGLLDSLAGPQENTWTWTRSTLGPCECSGSQKPPASQVLSWPWQCPLDIRLKCCALPQSGRLFSKALTSVILLPQSCGPRSKGLPADGLPQGGSPALYMFPSTFPDLQCGGLNPSVLLVPQISSAHIPVSDSLRPRKRLSRP